MVQLIKKSMPYQIGPSAAEFVRGLEGGGGLGNWLQKVGLTVIIIIIQHLSPLCGSWFPTGTPLVTHKANKIRHLT